MTTKVINMFADFEFVSTDDLTTSDEYTLITRYDNDHYILTHNDYVSFGFVIFCACFLALALYGFLFGGGKN